MDTFAIELLGALAKSSPAFAVLISWLVITIKKNKTLEDKIDALNKELRSTEKENQETLIKVNEVLTDLTEDSEANWKDVLNEIRHMKEIILAKLTK